MVEATGADPCDSMSREEIKNHLCAIADRHIAAMPTYTSIRTDPSKDLLISQGIEDGVVLTVCTMKAEGLTVDDFKTFTHPD